VAFPGFIRGACAKPHPPPTRPAVDRLLLLARSLSLSFSPSPSHNPPPSPTHPPKCFYGHRPPTCPLSPSPRLSLHPRHLCAMADTCIVCLLDLDLVDPQSLSTPHDDSEDSSGSGGPSDRTAPVQARVKHEPKHNDKDPLYDGDLIAHLPCGHFLHDDCLKPWVERANSCPTCRASFNVVELVAKIGGELPFFYSIYRVSPIKIANIDFFSKPMQVPLYPRIPSKTSSKFLM
jgi:hypothetical protein